MQEEIAKILVIHDNNRPDTLLASCIVLGVVFVLYLTVIAILDIRREKRAEKDGKKIPVFLSLIELALRVAIPVVINYFILTRVVVLTSVASGSMEPKLPVGYTAVYNRFSYHNSVPQRGDIICFSSSEYTDLVAKRVVGIPGDTLEFINGNVYINGNIADESEYIRENIETYSHKTFTVPDGCVFVLGDRRETSKDSRFWNEPYIPYENICGKYMGKFPFVLSFSRMYN